MARGIEVCIGRNDEFLARVIGDSPEAALAFPRITARREEGAFGNVDRLASVAPYALTAFADPSAFIEGVASIGIRWNLRTHAMLVFLDVSRITLPPA
jgi:hypothetical protein